MTRILRMPRSQRDEKIYGKCYAKHFLKDNIHINKIKMTDITQQMCQLKQEW